MPSFACILLVNYQLYKIVSWNGEITLYMLGECVLFSTRIQSDREWRAKTFYLSLDDQLDDDSVQRVVRDICMYVCSHNETSHRGEFCGKLVAMVLQRVICEHERAQTLRFFTLLAIYIYMYTIYPFYCSYKNNFKVRCLFYKCIRMWTRMSY